MKDNHLALEGIVASVLVVLLVLILNPMNFWMPNMAHMLVLGLLLICFVAYAAFILREKAEDERDVLHRMVAARTGFFTGTTLLTIGVFIDALDGTVDKWLLLTLVAMIIAKLTARLYADKNL